MMIHLRIAGGPAHHPPAMRGFLFVCLLLSGAFMFIALPGCTSHNFMDDAATVLQDRQTGLRQRLAAAEQLGPITSTNDLDQRWALYADIVWSDREPDSLRITLMDRLIETDAQRFWQEADQQLITIDRWPVMQSLFEQAIANQRQTFTPALMRSYARVSSRFEDAERPERKAIEKLNPDQTIEQTIWRVLAEGSPEVSASVSHRIAAWTLLIRLQTPEQLHDNLQTSPHTEPILQDLQAASQVLDSLPATREQVLWLMRWRNDAPRWEKLESRWQRLSPTQRNRLALRHWPLLINATIDELALSPQQLRATLKTRLAQGSNRERLVPRTDLGGVQPRPDERFASHANQLAWGDLLAIQKVLDQLSRPTVRQAFFDAADADHADTTTEYGGVLTFDQGLIIFPPDLTGLDDRYVAPLPAILRLQTELAHVHFQVQQHRHAEFAGPGLGDFRFVQTFGCHGLVATFVDRNTLNIDYYLGDRTVIDLGTIRR